MKYFFSRRSDPLRRFRWPKRVLWLFDFDGTLCPIVKRAAQAVLSARTRRLLQSAARRFPGRVGVLSGRPLKILRRKVRVPELLYGGTHGYELHGQGWRWSYPDRARRRSRLQEFGKAWLARLKVINGLRMENKNWTLCVHYGDVRRAYRRPARVIISQMCRQAREQGFKIQNAIRSVEILCDPKWDKGRSALLLKKQSRSSEMFYAGDDGTDETVFGILEASDVGVHVGRAAPTRARYFIRQQSESTRLLERMLAL